jgi:tRNA pseudouridine32 synthase/23S rRNA pseudouridine746 synthase
MSDAIFPVADEAQQEAGPWYELVADCADFLVIDKAPGVGVHRDGDQTGLVEKVAAERGYSQLYLVHRLDRMTSGLLLLAKSSAACAALAQQFAERRVAKLYVALSDRRPLKKQGSVRGDMERTRNGAWKLTRGMENPARTEFSSRSVREGLRLFALRPATGRTHQLRVKSVGAPILGDSRYGGSDADRGYLHACGLAFEHGGESFRFRCLPDRGELFVEPCVRAEIAAVFDDWLRGIEAAAGDGTQSRA